MKKILVLLFVILSVTNIHAQTHDIDSLKQVLQNEKTDTGRVLTLANLSFLYIESKPDTMMILALQALELSRKIGFVKGEAVSLNRIGNAYSSFGNYPKAMEVWLQALQINEKINNLDGKQRNLNNIGGIYFSQGDYQQALSYYFQSKAIEEQINNKGSLSVTLVNISATYLKLKIFDSASFYAQQAYNLAYQINYSRQIGGALNSMGEINSATEQNILALDNYRRGIPYSTKAGNFIDISGDYLGMAKLFEKIQQKDSVFFYAKQSLVIAKERGFILQLRDAARFLSHYYRKFNADSAFAYQDIAKDANDSLFSQQKQKQFQSLAFDEKLRQADIAAAELKSKEERKNNLQYAGIAVGLILFVIIFLLLSHSIIVNQKIIQFLGIVSLLLVFEFINLFIHPYLAHATNDSPLLMLLVLVCIAALLVPAHNRLEKWISHRLVEKNKKIRLAAAKKTIQQLEG